MRWDVTAAWMAGVGLVMSCASGGERVKKVESPRGAEPAQLKPWTLDEALSQLCQNKPGCEPVQTWDEVATGREGLFVVALRLSPESESDTCELSEFYRLDLRERDARLLARTCPEGRFTNELKVVPGQVIQQRTGGSMFNVVHDTFTYDLHAARPVETYHHEILGERGVERRASWRFGRLSGYVAYDLICGDAPVKARETMLVDAQVANEVDAATAAAWDWTGCSSPLDGDRSRVRIALVNATRLIVQWEDAVSPDDTGQVPTELGELHIRVGSARESLEQTGLICEAQEGSLDAALTTYILPVLTSGTHRAEGVEVFWHHEEGRLTGVIDFATKPPALALRLDSPHSTIPQARASLSPVTTAAPSPADAASTLRPHDLRLVGSPRARVELSCVVEDGEVKVDIEAWAAGREVQLIQEP